MDAPSNGAADLASSRLWRQTRARPQIALGELGDGGRVRRLPGIGIGVFPALDGGDELGRLGAGLLRRDGAVAADRDALRLAVSPRLNDVDLGACA